MSKKLEKGKSYGGWMEHRFSKDKDGYLLREKSDNEKPNLPDGIATIDFDHQLFGTSKYVGEISQGVPHGFGNLINPDGIKYEGMWWDGYEHGDGTRLNPNGEKIEGTWSVGEPFTVKRFDKKGNLVSMMIEDVPYEGEFKNYKPWNVNVYDGQPLNLVGQFINGDWNEGIPDGNGIQYFINSDNEEEVTIIGEFKGGQPYNGFKFVSLQDSKSYSVDIIKGKFEKANYVEGIQEETYRTVSFPDGFKYLGFYYKNKGLVYDEFDSQGNKTAQTISRKILEEKIDNPVYERLLKE